MRSQLDVRLGTEMPQIVAPPPEVASTATADDTIELANAYRICDGNVLSPSQELRLRNGMAQRSDGSWAASRVGDFGGRQGAGKTDTVIARILGGVLLCGERLIIYTAHEYPTANEIFLRIGGIFEAYDELADLVEHERRAHGDQGFELTNGRRILFKTRTGKSGRGFAKADLLIYDEAQHLQAEHVAGSGPAKLANPNSQAWWAGSGGLSSSVMAWQMRRQALLGTGGRLSYTEHTAEDITVTGDKITHAAPDPFDRDAWARANPGLGRWVSEESMADMLDELGPTLFARECLCVWEPEPSATAGPIDRDRWSQLIDGESRESADTVRLALDAPPDRRSATFATAGRRPDGLLHVQTRWHVDPENMSELVAKAKGLCDYHGGVALSVPSGSPALAWRADLEAAGVVLDVLTPAEVSAAFGYLLTAVDVGNLRHRGSPELANAIAGLTTKVSGDVEVPARRTSTANIAPIIAAMCALYRVPQGASVAEPFAVFG